MKETQNHSILKVENLADFQLKDVKEENLILQKDAALLTEAKEKALLTVATEKIHALSTEAKEENHVRLTKVKEKVRSIVVTEKTLALSIKVKEEALSTEKKEATANHVRNTRAQVIS